MKKSLLIIVQFILGITVFCQDKELPANSLQDIKEYITFLASDSLKGRFPGSPGDKAAAEYIRDHFRDAGLTLLYKNGFQYFEVTAGITSGKNNSLSFNGYNALFDKEFRPMNFTSNATVEAPVVFAGYGFQIETDSVKWNDYKYIDVTGKWVIILRGSPETGKDRNIFEQDKDEKTKALIAKDKGAAGVMFVSGLKTKEKEELMPLRFDQSKATAGLPVISITRSLSDKLMKKAPGKKNIEFLENSMIFGKQPASFDAHVIMKACTEVLPVKATTENVVALLNTEDREPGTDSEYIIVGAHFDHLGMGGKYSNSRKPDTVAVHNGADDNASGVAGVMELAKKIASLDSILPPAKRNIIFVAFSSEELGLLGSKHFIANPPVDKNKIRVMINFDMLGRYRPEEKPLLISGTGTAAEFDSILTSANKHYNLPLKFSPGGQEGSDQAAFFSENIPVLFFNTGMHEQYHTPEDDVDLINFEGETEVLNYAATVLIKLLYGNHMLSFQESGEKHQSSGGRFKVTLGIMPDYSSDNVNGLKVDDVRKGGTADKAGIKKGDIIISINGKSISNIYDYMNRLKILEPGNPAKVDLMRNGEKVTVDVQL